MNEILIRYDVTKDILVLTSRDQTGVYKRICSNMNFHNMLKYFHKGI